MNDDFGVINQHFHQRWSEVVDGVPNVRPAVKWVLHAIGRGFNCMEVGVASGVNAKAMLDLLRPRIMVLVDTNPVCGELVRGYPQCRFEIGDSYDVLSRMTPNSFDFVYIDADHSTRSVMADIFGCIPLVHVGGVLGGDDYDGGEDHDSSVDIAVLSVFDLAQVRNDGHDWWVTVTKEMKEMACTRMRE